MTKVTHQSDGKLPAGSQPESITLRAYQVGFGDCFLLTFHYPKKGTAFCNDRHVLIDFGSTALPEKVSEDKKQNLLLKVAEDIKNVCGGKLHAVVATHRHADHISCFATRKDGKGTGDIIRSLKPDVVVQPWTEDPNAKIDARKATKDPGKAFVMSLANMNSFSSAVLNESGKLAGTIGKLRLGKLAFLALDNAIPNESAVKNLSIMGENVFAYHGSRSGMEKLLPGVKIHVLGPPTLEQTDTIRQQRAKDAGEFWQLQAMAGKQHISDRVPLFSKAEVYKKTPFFARWLITRMTDMRADQLLELVRILDSAMNNTSVILLFEAGKKKLLFPGDAQLENWSYALGLGIGEEDEKKRKVEIENTRSLLENVDFYKVGHHGSLNATPKSLWRLFKRKGGKSKPGRLITAVSTRANKHGDTASDTEVPRETLVQALKDNSNYYTTQDIKSSKLNEILEFAL